MGFKRAYAFNDWYDLSEQQAVLYFRCEYLYDLNKWIGFFIELYIIDLKIALCTCYYCFFQSFI